MGVWGLGFKGLGLRVSELSFRSSLGLSLDLRCLALWDPLYTSIIGT